MSKVRQFIFAILVSVSLVVAGISCGGGGGGGDGVSSETASAIEGTVSQASANARVLGAGDGGIAGVVVSALGVESTSDEFGNFNLRIDSATFSGGPVQFLLVGSGIDTAVVLNDVAGGAGTTAFVDFAREDSGEISAESSDANGTLLASFGKNKLGCTFNGTFSDGGGGALWKPESERTGTVVVLMPPEYRSATAEVFNSNNDSVATPLIRDCCDHNGGREHVYWTQSAQSLAAMSPPLTVRFEFSDGTVDCREVPIPTQRYD